MTVGPAAGPDLDARARGLVAAWRTIRRRACKRYGYASIPFLAVFEDTKKGEPHLHILARCKWIAQDWLSEQMADLLGSPIVDIRRIWNPKQTAHYVAKYVGKAPTAFTGCKRYWRSLDYAPPDAEDADRRRLEAGRWYVVHTPFTAYVQQLARLGWTHAPEGDGRLLVFHGLPPPRPIEAQGRLALCAPV